MTNFKIVFFKEYLILICSVHLFFFMFGYFHFESERFGQHFLYSNKYFNQ